MSFKNLFFYHRILVFILFTSFGCKNTSSHISVVNIQPTVVQEQKPLSIPHDSTETFFKNLNRKPAVILFYQKFGNKPVWIEKGNYTLLADSMINIVRNIRYYGFCKGGYHLSELENLRADFSPETLLRKELLLTDAFFSLSEDLKYGLQRSTVRNVQDSLQIKLLNEAIMKGGLKKTLESQEPTLKGYTSLKDALRLMIDSVRNDRMDSIVNEDNIGVISINLERWRTENANISVRYIFVNIPSYMLDVVENDSTVLSSKVIVGTPETETPILSSVVECISIYPYWHVPRKISIEEYLPAIKRDSTFVSRNNFDILDRKGNILNPDSIEWSKFHENYFPVVLRQREGPENSLGVIKFVFDNPYAVFLHDTNAKRLFKSKTRAFSHGCIRMEKAVDLAHLLVTGVVGQESKYINKFLKEKQQHWVDLKYPIPIHVRYLTCEFKDNTFFRYGDVYGKDKFLYELLFGNDDNLDL